jgi:glucose/mannose-6-phosphate isomerase
MTSEIDKSNLRQVIIDFPNQFEKALEFAKDAKIEGGFDQLVICGMGGSALPADIVKAYLKSKGNDLDIKICRDYHLPQNISPDTLVMVSSYSGNTEETISCYQEAKDKNYSLVGLSKGGKIEEMCKEDEIPHIKYPEDGPTFQPRYALGYAFTAIITFLVNAGKVTDVSSDIIELSEYLKNLNNENKGKDIAQTLKGKIPIIYSTEKFGEGMVRIVKIKINENAKTQAFYNVFPELNHNEMVGFTNLQGDYHVIIFQDPDENERNLKRIEITSKLYNDKGIPVTVIKLGGKSMLQKLFSGIIIGDWISYYLALAYEQDPTPVEMVEELKKDLEK